MPGAVTLTYISPAAIVGEQNPELVTFIAGAIGGPNVAMMMSALLAGREALQGRRDFPSDNKSAGMSTKQAIPERVRAFGQVRLGGSYMLYAAKDGYSYDVVAIHDGLIEEFVSFMLNDNAVTLGGSGGDWVQVLADGKTYGSGSDRVRIQSRLGLATETVYGPPNTALSTLWPATARGDGVASLLLICQNPPLEFFSTDFPDGLPTPSAVVKAQRVYDWRLDSTREGGSGAHRVDDPDTWVWTDNPILCLGHYLVREMGFAFDQVIDPNLARWTAAAAVCEEVVSIPGDATEARYACGGSYYLSNAAATVIGAMLAACGGYLCDDGRGGLVAYAGKWYDPTITIDDTLDIVDEYYFERGSEAESSFNAFDVTFTNPAEAYNTGDAGRWRNEAVIAEDGEVRATSVDLPWVQSLHQAQRCIKIHDAKENSRLRGYVTGGLSLIQAYGEMIIGLNITDCAALSDITVMPTKIEVVDLMAGNVKISFVQITDDAFEIDAGDYLEVDATPSEGTGSNNIDTPGADSHTVLTTTPYTSVLFHLTAGYRSDVAYQVQYRTDPGAAWSINGPFSAVNDGGHADTTVYGLPASPTVYVQFRGYYSGNGGPATTPWGDTYTLDLS